MWEGRSIIFQGRLQQKKFILIYLLLSLSTFYLYLRQTERLYFIFHLFQQKKTFFPNASSGCAIIFKNKNDLPFFIYYNDKHNKYLWIHKF